MSPDNNNRAVYRADGVTTAERYLGRLCKRSFLSLWSHQGIYRDQGGGKEVCDLLVALRDHVLIFSDKDCAFPDTGNLSLDWCRWFRRGVLASAEQVWGAERWIRSYPNRLFLDRNCTHPFPIELPEPTKAKFHRIVVAHNASRRCRDLFGGSGSLIIDPTIVGPIHYADTAKVEPFKIGQIDSSRGFVHVFDDTALDIVMRERDTAVDFIDYLTKREAFILSGRLGTAAGEEELLAFYLRKLNDRGEHDFIVPSNYTQATLLEGLWYEFIRSPQRMAQVEADEISYSWDRLIETFNHHILAGTSHGPAGASVSDREKAVRMLASECRTARRVLAKSLLGLIQSSHPTHRSARVMLPVSRGGPFYLFLLLPHLSSVPEAQYREVRLKLLEAYCMVAKLRFQEATGIVGLATEPGDAERRSEDVIYLDTKEWTAQQQAEARSFQQDLGLLANVGPLHHSKEYEFPDAPRPENPPPTTRIGRNSPCPCGSQKKFKRCCGRRSRGD